MSAREDRAPVEHFERLARESKDPWSYGSSEYEQRKHRRTLAYVPDPAGEALELGCSIGVFTAMLAPRCSHLVAVDFSPTALARGRERVAGIDHVELRAATLPEQMPTSSFTTIVCSEVLYHWSPRQVEVGLRRIETVLAPGGTLVAVHWRHGDPRRALNGDDAHAILRRQTRLRYVGGESTSDYLIESWVRPEPGDA